MEKRYEMWIVVRGEMKLLKNLTIEELNEWKRQITIFRKQGEPISYMEKSIREVM